MSYASEFKEARRAQWIKGFIAGIIVGIVVTSVLWIFTGCGSVNNVNGSTVGQYNQELGQLQEQNRALNQLLSGFRDSIESIRTDATGAADDIDAAIRYFAEYDRRVKQLLQDYAKLQDQAGSVASEQPDTTGDTASIHNRQSDSVSAQVQGN